MTKLCITSNYARASKASERLRNGIYYYNFMSYEVTFPSAWNILGPLSFTLFHIR